jgi:hypothetical protein
MPSTNRSYSAGLFAIFISCVASPGWAQNEQASTSSLDEQDHSIVFELGAAGDWSRAEGFHPGGTFAFEVTPIEHWLELEIGVTAIHSSGNIDIPVDLLFKKPWPISPRFEFMAGVGPELIHTTGTASATFWGLSSVLDFMFWPRRNVGWYLEPGYEVTFQSGATRQGLGISGGLLIGR